MKIINLQAENFKKIKAVEIVPTSNVIEITGKCEQGKTSILDAIKAALCGEKFEQPVRDGAEKGKVVINLGDKIVTRTFTPSGGSLKVESTDGAKYPSPQALLDKLVGKIAFNPLEFARADSKKQVDMLLKVVDICVDAKKLQDVSGVVVETMPNPLDMLNTAYKTIFENRTDINRDLDKAKKILNALPDVPETKPVLLTELVAEKERLQQINKDNDSKREALERQTLYVIEAQEEIDEVDKQIRQLFEQKEKFLAELQAKEKIRDKMADECAELKDEDLANIDSKIAKADETNELARKFELRLEKQKEASKHQEDSEALTAKLEAIKQYKTEIINNAKFPVPGLDFAHGGVTFNGVPFSQASTAQKMRVGIAIGMAANPELRVIMLDGYESLDSAQREIVEKMAAENDFQVWTTAVDSSGTVGLYIEDGEIKNA